MIKFLDGDAITAKIIQTIRESDVYLTLISPYIKLSGKIKSELTYLCKNRPQVTIEVVFGKNDKNPDRSLSNEDFEFLKTLPNIRISYVKELHAKIYCSEDRLMLSSLNLHEFSQAYNYEAAFVIENSKSIIGSFVNPKTDQAWNEALAFVDQVIESSTPVYHKGKVYETSWLGFSTKAIEEYDEDNSESFFNKPATVNNIIKQEGFCIRTGVSIPFNIKSPYCATAYKSWKRYSNENYKEQYCHYSGEISNGETSLKSPILKKNWKKPKLNFASNHLYIGLKKKDY
jgi:phosphatidylserine/phosphatidylglycerophosphate/cardiolipin synthase-like enzyme